MNEPSIDLVSCAKEGSIEFVKIYFSIQASVLFTLFVWWYNRNSLIKTMKFSLKKHHLLIFLLSISIIIFLNVISFKSNFFNWFATSDQALAQDNNYQISVVDSESNCIDETTAISIPNTTFLKSYRLLTFTKINGAWPTKDGGYIVSGTTDPNIMFVPPDGFVAKLNGEGDVEWLRFLKTKNASGGVTMLNPMGEEDVQSIIELENGGYLIASKVWGFISTAESESGEEVNKILLTKLDKDGNVLWSKSFTAFVEDARNSLLETTDGGFLFYVPIVDLEPNDRGEDSDVYQNMPFASLKVFKFDLNGDLKWSKNLKNFIARDSDSYLITTPDGGYALAGNIAQTNSENEEPYDFDTYPGLVKFDEDFNFQWAKSMEGIPLNMAVALPKVGGGYEMGWEQVRQGAMLAKGLVHTDDGGYLVLGQWNGGLSLISDSLDLDSPKKGYYVAFKFSSGGELAWVKKMTLNFNEFTAPMTDFSVSLTADNKVIIAGPFDWADDDYMAKFNSANNEIKLYNEKYGEAEILKENDEKSNASQADYEKVKVALKIAQDAYRPGILMMKIDQDLNASWAKIINPQREVTNYAVRAAADSGAIIAGEHTSTDIKSVILDSITYYKDGFLMKLDASGNVKDDPNWLIDYSGDIVTELVTPYTLSNDLSIEEEIYTIDVTTRVPEFSLYNNYATKTFAPFNSSNTTFCPNTPAGSSSDSPLQNTPSTSDTVKTWPQINYERVVPVETVNDKSEAIHEELLPIFNELYSNEVKLTDNMDGSMLSYIFSRVITKDDLTAVKNYMVDLDYKTQDETTNQLTMYKPGYFLVMTFSVGNLNKAFLHVTY